MKILFIKPNMGLVQGRPYYDRGRMEPFTFSVLGGFTPARHELHLCDDRCEPVPYAGGWDVVGINVEIYTARRAYEIADRFRALGAKVVLGGPHVTLIPAEASAHADAVALGDTDAAWTTLLEDIEAGTLRPEYRGCGGTGMAGIRARGELYRGKRYLPVTLTQFSRGCRNRCEYCTTGQIYGGSWATRPLEEMAAELERAPRRMIFFVDDNIIADIPAAKALFRRMRPLGLRWVSQASLDFTGDPELMDLMLESGCQGLVVGFESRDPANLLAMNKPGNMGYGSYDQVVERMRSMGLLIWAAFLLGYDHETEASIRETVQWALSKKFAVSAFNVLMPYPGTPFYQRMAAEGRLLYGGKWWLHDDYRFGQVGFRPRLLSPERLSELGLWARLQHNSPYQILRRATDPKTNAKDLWSLLSYFAYNPLFRDELLKKHGMVLGYRGFETGPGNFGSPLSRAMARLSEAFQWASERI